MARRKWVIAIDGPAGAGKSTIAKLAARELGYRYVDTGAMYRAVAWKALRDGVPFDSPGGLRRAAEKLRIRFSEEGGHARVWVDGRDATHGIRTQKVTRMTNLLAAVKEVRLVLRRRQRAMGRGGGVVMEGRDIGTAVFPDADAKFFLDASPMERARRRYKELKARNKRVSLRAIAEAIRRRDHRDRTRGASPLRAAPDAESIDTTDLTPLQVSRKIVERVARRADGRR